MSGTGYTYPVLEGKVTEFEDYAKKCMRAFLMYRRDDPMDAPHEPMTVGSYYPEKVKELKNVIVEITDMSDEELLAQRESRLKKEIKNCKEAIKKKKKELIRLETMLEKVNEFEPPTEEHFGIAKFMREQLESTIESNSTTYYEKAIAEFKKDLEAVVSADEYRQELLDDKKEDLERSQKRLDEEIARCKATNEWCDVFFEAIKGKK